MARSRPCVFTMATLCLLVMSSRSIWKAHELVTETRVIPQHPSQVMTAAIAPILAPPTQVAVTITRQLNSTSAATDQHDLHDKDHTEKSLFPSNVMDQNSTTTRQRMSPLHQPLLDLQSHRLKNTTMHEKASSPSRQTAIAVVVDSKTMAFNSTPQPSRVFPWRTAAPIIDTDIPNWMEAYVQFHNESLHRVHNNIITAAAAAAAAAQGNMTIDTAMEGDENKYLIFQCRKSCSGTGNRQRAIFASFMVAMISKRIFLIDETYPVRLDSILHPHLIQWNWFPKHIKELQQQPEKGPNSKYQKVLKVRNKNPPVLDYPSKFMNSGEWSNYKVIRIEANNPVNMEQLWKRIELRTYLEQFKVSRSFTVPGTLYKQIFWTLFRPSDALTERAVALRHELGVMKKKQKKNRNNTTTNTVPTTTTTTGSSSGGTEQEEEEEMEKYIVIHARTGGGGLGWKDEDRFATDNIDSLYARAKAMRSHFLKSGTIGHNMDKNNVDNNGDDTTPSFPIIVVSDEAKAKERLKQKDPSVVRIANTKIVHVDRSKRKGNDLEGSLAVWADLLIIAQATCIVKGRGSFSMLGAWLATKSFGGACMQLVI